MSGPPPDHVEAFITVKVHSNGALSVEGAIHEKMWAIAVLQNAIDALRNYRTPKSGLSVPSHDVDLSI